MSSKRLLISLAHPDDESFGSGGLIAKYASQGVEVYYICATDGARGTVKPEFIERNGSVKATRYAELDCAADVLGFKRVYKLDYADSGMMGSADNQNPDCLWQADEDEVTGRIVAIMREVQPQVVITFDPFGGYGHPDHIVMHRATTRAFHAAADAAQFPDAGPAYQPQKLYYTVLPRSLVRMFIWQVRLSRGNPRQVGVNKDINLIEVLENTLDVTTKIDVRNTIDVWDAAARCHASQVSSRTGMPRWIRRLIASKQGLTRIVPAWQHDDGIEKDIFAEVE